MRTERVIFYQIPKCGGTWVKAALEAAGLHTHYCRSNDRHPLDLRRDHATPGNVWPRHRAGRFGFCCVRYPASWYKSFWCYRLKSQKFNKRFPLDKHWCEDFSAFVDGVLGEFPGGFVTEMYRNYVDDVHYVGRQETLADSVVEALRLAGERFNEDALRATEPRNVVSANPQYGDLCQMSAGTRARIEDAERWVVDRFYADE